VLDRKVQQAVDDLLDLGLPPMRERNLSQLRAAVVDAQQPQGSRPPVKIVDRDLVLADGRTIPVRILRPEGLDGALPAILYLHGGGWVMGDRRTHDRIMRELAVGARAAVVFVDYALAPETRFPGQNEQAYGALKAIARQAQDLALDGDRIAVAGDCAGGAIAAAVVLMAKARRGPSIVGQVLFYPITAPVSSTGSYATFAEGPGPTADDLKFFQEALLGERYGDASAFVLDTPLQQLAGLPPTLVVTAEADVVRDEGEAYARKLMRAGVRVTALRVNGTVHDFVALESLRDTPGTQAALLQANDLLRQVFQTPPTA
jgi:acetyl esterase